MESMEGKRGMPRLKPPFPTEFGFRGKPTLMHNVETAACVPAIIRSGGAWFKGLGRTEPGSKLYCVSGHVNRPGVYELPLGVTLDELVAATLLLYPRYYDWKAGCWTDCEGAIDKLVLERQEAERASGLRRLQLSFIERQMKKLGLLLKGLAHVG